MHGHSDTLQPSAILSSWVIHVQMLLANRTADTSKILIELGDRLWKEADAVIASHICYLLAGLSVEAPSPNSKIALLGADHRTPEQARFYVSPSAVQRTEIYEWVQRKATHSATSMIAFQGYKLIYAMILADHGKLETSFKYVNSMLTVIRAVTATMKPGTSMYLEGMQNQLTVLDDRLRQHLGQDRAESMVAASAKAGQGKWGIGSALSIMGKIVNRVVEGNDAPTPPTSGPGSGNGSMFQGAPRSNNSNSGGADYPSAAGYTSQAPPSSTGSYSSQQASSFNGSHSGAGQGHIDSQYSSPSYPSSQSGRKSAPLRSNDYGASQYDSGGFGLSQQPQHPGHQRYDIPQQGYAPGPSASTSFAQPQAQPKFQKPSLDLSGDAGPSQFPNDSPTRRASEMPRSPRSPRSSDAPGSDKGSSSSKKSDEKKAGRSKTPPPSRSSSGWLTGLSTFIAAKMNPEAKVAKLGEQMEAYFDEEKKRWVFPGETQGEEASIPSAPPIGPLSGSTPSSSKGGAPIGGGPPGSTHSAPGSIGGPHATPSDDPLAALMAPPARPSTAALMKKDPMAAMMAPPARPMYGQRSSTMPAKRPPRPQFAVFKPVAGNDQGTSGDEPPPFQ